MKGDLFIIQNIGLAGYFLAAGIYFLFSLLLLTSWKGRYRGGFFLVAISVSCVWCVLLGLNAKQHALPFDVYYSIEVLRFGVWLVFLLSLLGFFASGELKTNRKPLVLTVCLLLLIAAIVGMSEFFADTPVLIYEELSPIPLLCLFGLSLAGLVFVELIYRNAPDVKKWSIKFLCIGLGSIFVYDIFLYSNGLLFRQLDMMYWDARGFINLLVIPLMAVSVARSPQLALNIFVSRHIVFYTTALTGVGIYLLTMALGGYYIRVYGGEWGGITQTVFLFGAVLLLVIVLLSTKARAQLKVFIVKHFFSNKYDYRIEWLRLIDSLSTPEQSLDLQQQTIKSVAQIISARGGCLWLLNTSGYYELKASWNMKMPRNADENSHSGFVGFLQSKHWVVDLMEGSLPEGFVKPQWLNTLSDAWLVIPLLHEQSMPGFMVLEGANTTQRLTWEDTDLLKTVGRQLTSYLVLEQAAQSLSESKQFEAYNKLSAFVIHDLKNLVSQLSLVTQNAVQHMNNPLFMKDTVHTIDNCVDKMNKLLKQLRVDNEDVSLPARIGFVGLTRQAVDECSKTKPVPKLSIQCDEMQLNADSVKLTMVIRHLITNAQEATPPSGEVCVVVDQEEAMAKLTVSDSGCGMSEEFIRKRLFKPFDTTKSVKGMGIGAFEVKEYVQSAGGQIRVESQIDKGTVFTVLLPVNSKSEDSSLNNSAEVAHG